MRNYLGISSVFASLALLAGCATQSKPPEPPQPVPPNPPPSCCHSTLRSDPAPAAPTPSLDSASVYFDTDRFIVKEDYVPLLDHQTTYLNAATTTDIQVVGNTDERGSSEYNLALGQKRAEAVKKAMIARGAKAVQIEAVSYGKEKPVALDHDDAAWARNRRVDFVVSSESK